MKPAGLNRLVGSTPTASAPIHLDLGFARLALVTMENRYSVIDTDRSLNLMEVELDGLEFAIWDVRCGNRVLVTRWRHCTGMNLSGKVMDAIESLVCGCGEDWGPVCEDCTERVGSELAALYRTMQEEGNHA